MLSRKIYLRYDHNIKQDNNISVIGQKSKPYRNYK